MIIKPSGTFPLVGRRHSTIFTAPGATNIARGRIAPVQPKTNQVVTTQTAVGGLANVWRGLSPTEKDSWVLGLGDLGTAYQFFVSYNTPVMQWGIQYFKEWPGFFVLNTLAVATLYAEPDGEHMSLGLISAGTPPPGLDLYVRLYLQPRGLTTSPSGSKAQFNFFGSFGPVSNTGYAWFDVTDAWKALAGQWWYPSSVDTTARRYCGNVVNGIFYNTDQRGAVCVIDPGPNDYGSIGIDPGQIGPGFCPFQPGPPYPWPPSH